MILLGEYAVLEGAPALVCAVDRWAEVRLIPREGAEFIVESPSLGIMAEPFVVTPKGHLRFDPSMQESYKNRLSFFSRIFESVLAHLNERKYKLQTLTIALNTDDFYSRAFHAKLGFGSSAALTVALVYALLKYVDRKIGLAEIYALANKAHHEAQGKVGSGIDVAASTFGGRLIFRMADSPAATPEIPQRVAPWEELKLLTVWTGKAASTQQFVRGVNQLRDSNPALYTQLIERLSNLSSAGCAAYENKQLDAFLEIVGEYYSAMKELGQTSGMPIISEAHQRIAAEAVAAGLAYKPSGAGGGDIGLVFGRDESVIANFRQHIQELNFRVLEINAASEGVNLQEKE